MKKLKDRLYERLNEQQRLLKLRDVKRKQRNDVHNACEQRSEKSCSTVEEKAT